MRTHLKLLVMGLSAALYACEKPGIPAERAIEIGQKACAEQEASLSRLYGKRFSVKRTNWHAGVNGGKWTVSAQSYGRWLAVEVSFSGIPTKCQAGIVDA